MTGNPWDRIDNPALLPSRIDADSLRDLDDERFTELIRSNLMPRDNLPAGRDAWRRFWATLADWPDLKEDALDVLADFIDATEQRLQQDPEDKRAARFLKSCADSRNRLDPTRAPRTKDTATYAEQLLAAIATHRTVILSEGGEYRDADTDLWAWLNRKPPRSNARHRHKGHPLQNS